MKESIVPFAALLCLFVLIAAVVVRPLATALIWAAVISFISYPIYRFIHVKIFKGRYSYLAAGINTGLMLFVLVLPAIGIGIAIMREIAKLYSFFVAWYPKAGEIPLESILSLPQLAWIFSAFPDISGMPIWSGLASHIAGVLASIMTGMSREMVGNAFKLAYKLLVIVVATFFMTRDGHKAVGFIRDIIPLSSGDRDSFFMRVNQMLYAIFYGIILTAGVQGALGALGWWFVGLGSPAFFGALMFILAMFPFIGTPIIWVPGVIYLFSHGDSRGGIVLLLWGLLVVSSIDNLLRPIFISEGSKAHMLLIFVGILGGLSAWGFLGIFMGPLALSSTYFLMHLYRLIVMTPGSDTDADRSLSGGAAASSENSESEV